MEKIRHYACENIINSRAFTLEIFDLLFIGKEYHNDSFDALSVSFMTCLIRDKM